MRLFIAINFPTEFRSEISAIRDNLKAESWSGNFSYDDNLHLTLVFLGECDIQQVDAIKSIMNDTKFSQFSLTIEEINFFKRHGGNTWWVGLQENKTLSDLQVELTKRLRFRGFSMENRKFSPHVTIGREVKVGYGFVQPEVKKASCVIKSMELMKSEHIDGKLTYTPVYQAEAV
ncbi:MAG: RNA 2',3'-cyclic phosphodiesterase [Marinilabiliaceae bacterium]|nr:RNA 2',3'-cyclic phosphodiesterase [Marinilabiliaceae bacterium]